MGVLLTGMHRSGTSMLARWVDELGVPAAPGTPFPVDSANSEGLFELQDVVSCNDQWLARLGGAWAVPPATTPQTWRALDPYDLERSRADLPVLERAGGDWYVKDPRICLLLPLWDRLALQRLPVIAMVRPHRDVAMSLAVRNGFTHRRALALWAEYNRRLAAGPPDRGTLLLDYEAVLTDPDHAVAAVAGSLHQMGLAVSAASAGQVAATVKPELKRQGVEQLDGSAERLAADLDGFLASLRESHLRSIPQSLPDLPDWVDEALDEMRELWTVTRERDELHDRSRRVNRVLRRARARFTRRHG